MHSRSKPDPVAEALDEAARRLSDAVTAVAAANPVVLIDGRSGACKSALARRLAEQWPIAGEPQLISLDALYPGWDGLTAGVDAAHDEILHPHGRGLIGTWRRWDWESGDYAEAHAVNPALGLIVEGCGALTPRTARLADVRVWVQSSDAARKARALARDGEMFRPHWERWAAQEHEHIERNAPHRLADFIVQIP